MLPYELAESLVTPAMSPAPKN